MTVSWHIVSTCLRHWRLQLLFSAATFASRCLDILNTYASFADSAINFVRLGMCSSKNTTACTGSSQPLSRGCKNQPWAG
ncbi:hypothetical protein F5Y00DRAFT_222407 [Daldinia vernicosa]|uniref:uncharacterized protein n=1 Tax=Daldinia vernicosa TaxID=114800 RepID=UPI0020083FE8|nr:uncharacterized protein F5Y00DRAFT_222407 [Daldinia vernicosa]KAI0854145.1 hypothetical protein F5Y00DRAFT_222407 [Daldinia vernicosa]